MNRILALAAVLTLTVGCATAVEDPQPTPTPDQPQQDPPAQTLGGELNTPPEVAGNLDRGIHEIPVRQTPPMPFNEQSN